MSGFSRTWRPIGAFVVITAWSACAAIAPSKERSSSEAPVATLREPLQGAADDGAAHPFAVGLCMGANIAACDALCSGALILPNLVVTARHCVDTAPDLVDCSSSIPPRFGARRPAIWVTTHGSITDKTSPGWHRVASVITPTDDRVCGNDLALLVLNAAIPSSEATPITPGVQYAVGDTSRYERSFTSVGYGVTSPAGFGAGTRRILHALPVVCIPGDEITPCPDIIPGNEFFGGDGPCPGDSGSSAFEEASFNAGQPVSLGVASRAGQSTDGKTCVGSIYTRLDVWRTLIVQAAVTASQGFTLYPKPVPDWTVYVPPLGDAGAGADATAQSSNNLAAGYACTENAQCKSQVCADTGAGKACTEACNDTLVPTSCPSGFVCSKSVCIQDLGTTKPEPQATSPVTAGTANEAAARTSPASSGCSVGRFPTLPTLPTPRTTPGGNALGWLAGLGSIAWLRARRKKTRLHIEPVETPAGSEASDEHIESDQVTGVFRRERRKTKEADRGILGAVLREADLRFAARSRKTPVT